ncbi:DNA repair protein RecO [Corynebacterium macclintockiae]|uniref:DNA repair protein RecO n=1 Tax=Corynebacterium macclintockiae TaxID=2913501 RepID=UPI003EB8D3B1
MSRRSRPSFRDEAFVLRTYKLGEADLILVLLTKDHGLIRAVAKGIRKTRSRFGARLDRFSRVDVQIYPGRSLANVTDAATVATYASRIVADVDRFYAATAMLEMAQVFAAEPSSSNSIFFLLDAALQQLITSDLPPVCVADEFVLHGLEVAGWAPSLVDCAQCGKPGPHRAFHPAAGGAVCVTCRPPGAFTPPSAAVHVLWLLKRGRHDQAAQEIRNHQGQDIAATAHLLVLAHVRQQLEVGCPAYAAL